MSCWLNTCEGLAEARVPRLTSREAVGAERLLAQRGCWYSLVQLGWLLYAGRSFKREASVATGLRGGLSCTVPHAYPVPLTGDVTGLGWAESSAAPSAAPSSLSSACRLQHDRRQEMCELVATIVGRQPARAARIERAGSCVQAEAQAADASRTGT